MENVRISPLLSRIASAAGVALVPALVAYASSVETVCVVPDPGVATCPSAAEALVRFADTGDWGAELSGPILAVLGEASPVYAGGDSGDSASDTGDTGGLGALVDCCYTVELDHPTSDQPRGGVIQMGCMGRPLVDGERPVLAGVRLGRARKLSPTIAALGAERRRVLTEFWTTVALAEHASIAEFHRVSLELMRHGAPAELLAAAQRAAADEARHARHAFALASAYAGRSVQPAALPLGDTVALAPDLVSLASTTLRDGCAGETCSAWLYARLADRATDPTARRVLHGIVRDETRHAELAWAVLRWAVKAGGAPVRAVVRSELRAAPPAMAIGPAADDASLAAHGWAPAREQARFIEEVWRAVVVPVAAALAA